MEKKVNLTLNCVYYGFYVLVAAAAGLMWYMVKNQLIEVVLPQTTAGQAIQYVVICYVIASVAGGLYGFKKIIDKAKTTLTDKDMLLQKYRNWGIARISVIGVGAVTGIIAFYLMGGYTSMLWCAGISLIGLYFCKPTMRKMEIELSTEGEQPMI